MRNLKKWWPLLLLLVLIAFPQVVNNGLVLRVIVTALIYSLGSMGNNVIVGCCGLLTTGHGAFYGLGAYVSAILSTSLGFPFWACVLCTILGSMLFGLLISIPCLRVQADFLSLITIAFAQIFYAVIVNWTSMTGGPRGIINIPPAELFGYKFTTQAGYYYLALSFVVVVYIALNNIIKSPVGRAMQAVRDDEIGAKAMGININKYKIIAFVLGSTAAGLGGCLMAHYLRYLGTSSFTLDCSLLFMQMIILGGLGSLPGSILGAFFFTVIPEIFRPLAVYRMGVGGLIMLIVVLVRPQGLLGSRAFSRKDGGSGFFFERIFRKKAGLLEHR